MNQPDASSTRYATARKATAHNAENHQATDRAFTLLASVAVIVAIIAGFWLLGAPNKQRLISLDRERINDLMQIAGAINREYGGTAPAISSPPGSLAGLDVRPGTLKDPVTDMTYDYRRLSDSTYELCATFATSSLEPSEQIRQLGDERWAHPEGRHCYEFEVANRDPNP